MQHILLAFFIDATIGDPPNRFHPVAWMGTLIAFLKRAAPTEGHIVPLLAGGLIAIGGAAGIWALGWLIQKLITPLPFVLRTSIEAAILKSTFSLNGLIKAARDVERALEANDIEQARHWVSWHLVSRDTSELNESQLAAATIESLAENLSDGIIAPLLYYLLGGLPAALAYRYLNTCDSMLGYRDAEREWLGKIPAWADDVANLVPARLTAWGILSATMLRQYSGPKLPEEETSETETANPSAITIYRRDCATTDSPNAGHPMSAMAGALSVELEKRGHYRLGKGLAQPKIHDIHRAIRLVQFATGICLGMAYGIKICVTRLRAAN